MDTKELIGMTYIGLGVALFLASWIRGVYCWIRLNSALTDLMARLRQLSPSMTADLTDYFRLSGNGLASVAQKKLDEAINGQSFSELEDVKVLRARARKYRRGFYTAVFSAAFSFCFFFLLPIAVSKWLHRG